MLLLNSRQIYTSLQILSCYFIGIWHFHMHHNLVFALWCFRVTVFSASFPPFLTLVIHKRLCLFSDLMSITVDKVMRNSFRSLPVHQNSIISSVSSGWWLTDLLSIYRRSFCVCSSEKYRSLYHITWSFCINCIKSVDFTAINGRSWVWNLEEESCFPPYVIFQVSFDSSRSFQKILEQIFCMLLTDCPQGPCCCLFTLRLHAKTDNLFALQKNVSYRN